MYDLCATRGYLDFRAISPQWNHQKRTAFSTLAFGEKGRGVYVEGNSGWGTVFWGGGVPSSTHLGCHYNLYYKYILVSRKFRDDGGDGYDDDQDEDVKNGVWGLSPPSHLELIALGGGS